MTWSQEETNQGLRVWTTDRDVCKKTARPGVWPVASQESSMENTLVACLSQSNMLLPCEKIAWL